MTEELEKISAAHDRSQPIGEFLDWLRNEQHIDLCTFKEAGNNGEPMYLEYPRPERYTTDTLDNLYGKYNWTLKRNGEGQPVVRCDNPDYQSWPDGYYPVSRSIQEWLALYFDIDLHKADAEREQLLERIRAQHKEVA
jgi:hypothetical protein